MRMTFGKRILMGFGITILLTAGLGIFNYTRIAAIDSQFRDLANLSLPQQSLSSSIESNTMRACAFVLEHIRL